MALKIVPNFLNEFPKSHRPAVERAIGTWSDVLDSPIPVKVNFYWTFGLSNTMQAICVPNGQESFPLAPELKTWYTSALADKLSGRDLQPNEPDMAVLFNGTTKWYFGTASPGKNEYDLESIALHEMCHGFGFLSLLWYDNKGNGTYGSAVIKKTIDSLIGTCSLDKVFPFQVPNLKDYPCIYDRYITDGSGKLLTDTNIYSNDSSQLGAAITSNNLFFHKYLQYSVYAPTSFAPFTSISHLNGANFPNSLMRPAIGEEEIVCRVDTPVRNILSVIGW